MHLFDTTQVGLERALAGAAARQSAIANNMANANTPGYVRTDVDFESALASAFSREDRSGAEEARAITVTSEDGPVRADGSSIDAEFESAAEAKNGLQYEAISAALSARSAIMRAAIGAS